MSTEGREKDRQQEHEKYRAEVYMHRAYIAIELHMAAEIQQKECRRESETHRGREREP